jgi:hypothetical protein
VFAVLASVSKDFVGVWQIIAHWMISALLILGGLFLVYLVLFDQGALLEALTKGTAVQPSYLHELFHDGRHLAGVACH